MNFESKVPDDTNNFFEVETFSNTENSDSEEFRKVQSSSLTDSHNSKNVNNYDVTSESNATLNKTSHIVEFNNHIACETVQNEQANEPVELSAEIKITTNKCDKTNYMLKEKFYSISLNLVDLSQATTSQDNSSFLSCTNEANILHTDRNKIKRSSKCQVQINSDTLIEKSDSSDEVLSKRQKLNENVCNTSEGNLNDNTVTFQRNTLIAEQQNYYLINESPKNESSNTNLGTGSETANNYQSNPYIHEDNWDEWEAINEDEGEKNEEDDDEEEDKDEDENNKKVADYQEIKKKFPNWHIVPEVISRQIGSNPLFDRRFYSSLYAVEQFQLMYKLYPAISNVESIDILNFNHKGNLIMCAICDEISIWDWVTGKKNCSFTNDNNVLHAKWLLLDNLMVFCGEDGQICLLNLERNMSEKLVTYDGRLYKFAVHPETPYVILAAGINSKVLSIDIRESKPKELLLIEENSLKTVLYSIDSNPSNSNEFCIAGQSYCVMIYDRRKVSKPLCKLWPNYIGNNQNDVHVMSAMYNYNGTEILASYNNKNLFLFNRLITSSGGDYGHMYQNMYRSSIFIGNFFGPKSEYVVAGSNNNIFIWEKNSESIIQYMTGDRESVNYLEGHPHIPILATSGRDNNVKLWVPSKGKLSVILRSFGNFYEDELHYESNSNLDEDDINDIHTDDENSFSSSTAEFIEDNLSECGDVERIQCASS
ncbi:WD repeat-containing protein 42A [Acromyrmex echinatior]|uniref:WD repeat-containing protein 42A n=2 Tax=Acromyrmex echinatior TaxID=103372 RepID=F4W7C6_ACREC|nr:WD repeat-containing protein 42A [Acromyrmex echinatior]